MTILERINIPHPVCRAVWPGCWSAIDQCAAKRLSHMLGTRGSKPQPCV